jgi:hypothetical protein
MGLTMRGYRLGFGMKSRWSLQSKVMETSNHFGYSGVADETVMTTQAVSFYVLLDSLSQNHLRNEGFIFQDPDRVILDEARMQQTHIRSIQNHNYI